MRSCHHLELFGKELFVSLDLEGRVETNAFIDTRFRELQGRNVVRVISIHTECSKDNGVK